MDVQNTNNEYYSKNNEGISVEQTDDKTATEQQPEQALNDQQIKDFLLEHPQWLATFLEEESDFFAELPLGNVSSSGATSFAQRQTQMLREKQAETHTRLNEYIANVSNNAELFEQSQSFILALLRCRSIETMVDSIHKHFKDTFKVEFTQACIIEDESDNIQINFLNKSGKDHFFSGALRESESQDNFSHDKAKSAVVLSQKLSNHQRLIIAVGSSDADYYFQGIGEDFIRFITQVCAEKLNHLIETQ